MALPLGIPADATSKVTLRGLNLDQASEVKLAEPLEGVVITIKGKGKAEVPKESDPALYGDTKLDLEIKLPSETPESLSLLAVNAAGVTRPYALALIPKVARIVEKEQNGGFTTAQPIEAGQTVQGVIEKAMDVDVFKIVGKKGETWVFKAEAQSRGSVLDPMITLHDEKTHIVATADDSVASRDPEIKVTLPADGVYFLSVMDAHNAGGATHAYLLRVLK